MSPKVPLHLKSPKEMLEASIKRIRDVTDVLDLGAEAGCARDLDAVVVVLRVVKDLVKDVE